MKAYSSDLRKKIIEAYQKKEGSLRKLAKRFSVSFSFVWRLVKRFRKSGNVAPKPHGGGLKPKLDQVDLVILREVSDANQDATLAELSDLFFKRTEIRVSGSTITQKLRRLRISRKKKTMHATERDTPGVQKERHEFQQDRPNMPVKKLIFIDEAGINIGMARTYGRGPIGTRVEGHKPHNTGSNISLVGAIGLSGITTIMMLEGAVDGTAFETFIEKMLAPTLQPGDIVLMDNVKTHKGKKVEEIIRSTGAQLRYLPRYSPDFSPIENCWSKLKELLRGIAARTVDTLEEGVKNALDKITEKDVKGWFKHCGYCIQLE
jgi:transposase